jgi:hypothetical protein
VLAVVVVAAVALLLLLLRSRPGRGGARADAANGSAPSRHRRRWARLALLAAAHPGAHRSRRLPPPRFEPAAFLAFLAAAAGRPAAAFAFSKAANSPARATAAGRPGRRGVLAAAAVVDASTRSPAGDAAARRRGRALAPQPG